MRALLVILAACGGAPPREQPHATTPPKPALIDPLSETSLIADITWLTAPARRGRGSTSEEAKATARWIAEQLRTAGYQPSTQDIPSLPGQVNVIAEVGPTSERAAVVMAHYDHVGVIDGKMHPGADDNASGVAVALAVARAAGRDRHLVFVFTGGEEVGLDGAKAFVAAPPIDLAQIRVAYNLDMVGRHFFASTIDHDAELAAVGLPGDGEIFAAALEAAQHAGLNLIPVRPGLVQVTGEARRSDDWVLRDHGIYAVHFSTGLNDDYHTPTDTLDKLSRPQLVRITKFLAELVAATPP